MFADGPPVRGLCLLMGPSRIGRLSLITAALVLLCAPAVRAQDVLRESSRGGTPAPSWVTQLLREDPTAFQFRRGWRNRVEEIRRTRRSSALLQGPAYSSAQLVSASAALSGTYRIPVIAGLYSDAAAPYPRADYQRRLFEDGDGTVSLSEYYAEISRGVFELTGDVTEWLTLPEAAEYYEPVDSAASNTESRYGKAGEFLRDALTAADSTMDFGMYDNDGPDGVPNSGDDDGYVDTVAFLYAANPKSCGGSGIWPHRWVYEGWWGSAFVSDDPSASGGTILVSDYIIQSGLACRGTAIMASGTIAHEMGHALGLPDLYDTDSGDGTDSEGVGHWDLMGSGGYRTLQSPAHMGAWSKEFLGWVDVTSITENQSSVTLPAVATSGSVFRFDVEGTAEYFLLENRQPIGSDYFLHGTGLVVWHVDDDVIEARRRLNRVNADAFHKGVDVEEADGLDDLDRGENRGDSGDSFPGATSTTVFDGNSTPGSRTYAGDLSGLALTNITEVGGQVTLSIGTTQFVEFLWGDVTGDDLVTLDDVELMSAFVLGVSDTNVDLISRGDIDADGDVDVRDMFLVHTYLEGLPVAGFRVGEVGAATSQAPTPAGLSPPTPDEPEAGR